MTKVALSPLIYTGLIEPFLMGMKKWIAKIVRQDQLYPVLDLCCGTGRQASLLALGGEEVFGLDLSREMLNYAQEKYSGVSWMCADATQVPMRQCSVKAVVLSFALHEKSEELQQKMIDEIKRLLSPGGRIIFVDFENHWNIPSKVGGVFVWMIERMAGREHFRNGRRFLASGGLRSFIIRHGLTEIKRINIEMGSSSMVVAKTE